MGASRNIAPGAPGAKAVPTGGAAGVTARWCRGCRPRVSQLGIALVAGLLAAPLAAAQQILPTSGLEIEHHDIIAQPPVWRVRYIAPHLAQDGVLYADVAGDMELLCTQDALARIVQDGGEPSQIVITLMSAPVVFGEMTPGVTQFFESYSVESDLCIWEAF
ncbi:hypothetical protein ANTHELSMS3_04031 [Antarctobacter heliothermus]|uniref:Acetolactate synthase n=1 Tax=Antarctobacter heliothermus TaxID=74033 RepID=A0A222E987_9RHOB|nr:hypothetical protein ANTHELSMS3_04031 [Antarctobacter heliothermus]